MNYLVVVAHPDDEVIGAGATIKKLTDEGNIVDLCIMSIEAQARATEVGVEELSDNLGDSSRLLGISKIYAGSFPNIEMNTVNHLALVQFIEKAIISSKPDVILTHHPIDTNNDHLQTFLACQAAMRLFQRRDDIKPISEIWLMEVISSTEWSVNPSYQKFEPNFFVEIGMHYLETKIEALNTYRGVMRKFPHPRCEEVITGLAAYRGGQSGLKYAEAFDCVFRRLK